MLNEIIISGATAQLLNDIDDFIKTIPIKEVDDGPRLYIKKDLENGRIY